MSITSSRWSSTTSFCDAPLAAGRRTLRIALRMASAMGVKNGRRFGSLPSLVIGMYGVVILSQTAKFVPLGAVATVWARPQPNTSTSLLSRVIDNRAAIGVRLTLATMALFSCG